MAIVRDGMEFDELTGHGEAEVVLDRTPFYAEGGGQVGDQGTIREPGGGSELFTVTDTQKPVGGLIVHRGTLHGRLRVGETVEAVVDAERRAHTMRNHTGTHLLHRALRNVVGERARQAGSLVTPDYLRFDYPFDRALTDDEKRAIEDEVRGIVRDDRPVTIAFMPMAEAIEQGADAFFDEKYGETVRTIRVEDYSFELCGGTHCRATGQIGGFVITGERSIGSGMRRIEAVTGAAADRLARERERDAGARRRGGRRPDDRRRRGPHRGAPGRAARDEAPPQGRRGVRCPAAHRARPRRPRRSLRASAWSPPRSRTNRSRRSRPRPRRSARRSTSGVIALLLDADAPQVFVTVSDDLVERGISAGDLVKAAAAPDRGQGRRSSADGAGDGHRPLGHRRSARLGPWSHRPAARGRVTMPSLAQLAGLSAWSAAAVPDWNA